MSSDENDEDIPCAEECQKLCENFADVTGTDTACAQFYLQDRKWNLETSLNDFFEDRAGKGTIRVKNNDEAEVVVVVDGSAESLAAAATAVVAESALSRDSRQSNSSIQRRPFFSRDEWLEENATKRSKTTERIEQLKFITWNIDGLSENNVKLRTKAVLETILKIQADVVFLQEVIPESAEYFVKKLPQYECTFGNMMGYFVGTLLKKSTISCENIAIHDFPNSRMARNILTVNALVNGNSVCLMNSHLESTADSAAERKSQLQEAFRKMQSVPKQNPVIFAGDLNLRDKELEAMNGIPNGVVDVWIACGSRKECSYTWDQTRNDNLQSFSRFKPRCRFDRVYFQNSNPSKLKPTYFGLIGLERLLPHRCFPSDHWGILCHFDCT